MVLNLHADAHRSVGSELLSATAAVSAEVADMVVLRCEPFWCEPLADERSLDIEGTTKTPPTPV